MNYELENVSSVFNSDVDIISFDVFDTLISRALEQPEDLFYIMAPEVYRVSEGRIIDFHRHRHEAEHEAWHQCGEKTTLNDIYDLLKKKLHVGDALINELIQLEIAHEKRICRARPLGKKLWNAALESQKRIICVSDMYLPANVIEDLLKNAGYSGYERLFVSSEHGAAKSSGRLFSIALESCRAAPGRLAHIGDNEDADSKVPSAMGIACRHIPRSMEEARKHHLYSAIFRSTRSPLHSVVKGLIAERLFDEPGSREEKSLFQNKVENLGYACLGPMITGFALWLARRARAEDISHLYFLAREGWILQQVYNCLTSEDEFAIPSTYLYASRRAVAPAFVHEEGDIRTYIDVPAFTPQYPPHEMLKRFFGIEAPLSDADEGHSRWRTSVEPFLDLCLLHKEAILDRMREERRALAKYLEDCGLRDERNPALADLGGAGTIQLGLSRFMNRKLPGFYLYTADRLLQTHSAHGEASAYVKNFAIPEMPDAPLQRQYVYFMEMLCGHTEQSVERFVYDQAGSVGPSFYGNVIPQESEEARIAFIGKIQSGALEFARDFRERLGPRVRDAYLDPGFVSEVFRKMVTRPEREDLMLWQGLMGESHFSGCTPTELTEAALQCGNGGFPLAALAFSSLEHADETGEFDPSLKGRHTIMPTLQLPDAATTPEEYLALHQTLLKTVKRHVRHILGKEQFECFANRPDYRDSVPWLLDQASKLVRERHMAYLQQAAEELAGKEVYYFGCGAAYQEYKYLFRSCLPRNILVTLVSAGTPQQIDGIPLAHPEDVLHGTTHEAALPMVVFTRLEHGNAILRYLARLFPRYAGNNFVNCVLLPE
ncbi:MAG: hypothetical protein DELT_02653 [Desulfovibrio sp.]